MAKVYSETKPSALVIMSGRELWQVAMAGLIVGLLVWGLTLLLDHFVYTAILCHGDASSKCTAAPEYAAVTAAFIGGGAGLFALVRLQIFRPLLVVVGALIALWGIVGLTAVMPWYGAAISIMVLYALAYALFSWVVRLRSFILALIVLIILIVIVHLGVAV